MSDFQQIELGKCRPLRLMSGRVEFRKQLLLALRSGVSGEKTAFSVRLKEENQGLLVGLRGQGISRGPKTAETPIDIARPHIREFRLGALTKRGFKFRIARVALRRRGQNYAAQPYRRGTRSEVDNTVCVVAVRVGQKGRIHSAERTALEKGLQDTLPAVGPRGAASVYRNAAAALLDDDGVSLSDVE